MKGENIKTLIAEFYADKNLSFKIDTIMVVDPPLSKMRLIIGPNNMETEFWLYYHDKHKAIYILDEVVRAYGAYEVSTTVKHKNRFTIKQWFRITQKKR